MNKVTDKIRRQRVMIVDDDAGMREIFSCLVRGIEQAECDVAGDANEALSKVTESQVSGNLFSLILMDIRMPSVDGNEATKLIREAGYKGQIVAFTATASGMGEKTSLDAGINVYLDKRSLHRETIEALLDQAKRIVPK